MLQFEKSTNVTIDLAGEFYPENAKKRMGTKPNYLRDSAVTVLTFGTIVKGIDATLPHVSIQPNELTIYHVNDQTTNTIALNPEHVTLHVGILRATGNALSQGGAFNMGGLGSRLQNTYTTYLEIQTPDQTISLRVSSLRLYLAIAHGALANRGWDIIDDLNLFANVQKYTAGNYREFENFLNDPQNGFTKYAIAAGYPEVANYDGTAIVK